MILDTKVGSFLGLTGALFCTPIAFTFPAMFHLKTCADTLTKKAIDWTIIIFSIGVMFFCGIKGAIEF